MVNAKTSEILNAKGKTEILLKLHDQKEKLINNMLGESESCPPLQELQSTLQDICLIKGLKQFILTRVVSRLSSYEGYKLNNRCLWGFLAWSLSFRHFLLEKEKSFYIFSAPPPASTLSRNLIGVLWVFGFRDDGVICWTDPKLGAKHVKSQAPFLFVMIERYVKQTSYIKTCLLNTQRFCLRFF